MNSNAEAEDGARERCSVSVVAPVCNEEGNIAPFLERLEIVLASLGGNYEFILVDDGSQDASWSEIQRLAEI